MSAVPSRKRFGSREADKCLTAPDAHQARPGPYSPTWSAPPVAGVSAPGPPRRPVPAHPCAGCRPTLPHRPTTGDPQGLTDEQLRPLDEAFPPGCRGRRALPGGGDGHPRALRTEAEPPTTRLGTAG